MEQWKKVAIDRIAETIERIKNHERCFIMFCPVCKHMKAEYNMICAFSRLGPCINNLHFECPAWRSCREFVHILDSLHDKTESKQIIHQLTRLIESLK